MNKLKWQVFPILLLLFSCATTPPGSSQKPDKVVLNSKEIAVNKPAEDRSDGRPLQIRGASKIGAHSGERKTYFLYGAEHLNLKNNYFDIPVVYNKSVKKWMNYFLVRGKTYFERYVQRSGRYAPIIGKILEDYGLPRDLIFVAMAESGFQNNAKSWAKAVGPWQFMPLTGKSYGLEINWYLDERRDPIKASIAASKYLTDLFKLFGSWELAAAAYNAGEGKVGRAIKRYKTNNFWKIRQGRYLKSETKNYVPKIMALAIIGKNLRSFGFGEVEFHEPLDFDEVTIPGYSDLKKVAKISGIPFAEIQRLNPEILRWHTPPGKDYPLRVPVGMKTVWSGCCKNADILAVNFQEYKMRSNSDLRSVAKKFKLPVKVLAQLNEVSKKSRMKKGQMVKLPFRAGQSRKDAMYGDLYEKRPRRARKWRSYRSRLKNALGRGRNISSPKEFYTVKKGDTLWHVAKKTGVSLDTIIKSNYSLVKGRMIRAGDRLVIK